MTRGFARGKRGPFLAVADSGQGGAIPAVPPLRSIARILEDQAALIPELERLMTGKSRDALAQPDHDGGWGAVEIASHLLDWERVTHDRVHRILNEDQPALPEFDDSLWAVEHHYRDNDAAAVLADLREHREALVAELSALDEVVWDRTADLEDQGEITLRWLMNRICDHDSKHLQQVRDALT